MAAGKIAATEVVVYWPTNKYSQFIKIVQHHRLANKFQLSQPFSTMLSKLQSNE